MAGYRKMYSSMLYKKKQVIVILGLQDSALDIYFIMSKKLGVTYVMKIISEHLHIISRVFRQPSMKYAELCNYFISSDVLDILMLYPKFGTKYCRTT